jgi:hypothetical protein
VAAPMGAELAAPPQGGLFFFALQKNGRIRGMLIATHRWAWGGTAWRARVGQCWGRWVLIRRSGGRMVGTLLGFCTAAAIISGVLDIQAGIWSVAGHQPSRTTLSNRVLTSPNVAGQQDVQLQRPAV